MPEVSRFFGIVILMYFNDHSPPHFHVRYEEHRARVEIETLRMIDGKLPARVLGLVVEWADLHRDDLLNNWDMLRTSGTFKKIEPLT